MHLKLKNKYLETKLIKSDFKILKIFIKLNIIKNIKLKDNSNNIYIISLNNESFFKEFINFHKPSKPVKITLKNLKNLNKKSSRLFLMSTNKGLINNIEAEQLKIGGFIILDILQ